MKSLEPKTCVQEYFKGLSSFFIFAPLNGLNLNQSSSKSVPMGELVTYRQNDFGPSDSVDLRQMSNAFRVILWIVGVGIQPLQLCLAFQAFTFASHSRINPSHVILNNSKHVSIWSTSKVLYNVLFCLWDRGGCPCLSSPGNKKENPKWFAFSRKVNRSIFSPLIATSGSPTHP